MQTLSKIFWLGTKELRSFFRDWVLLGLVIYSFSLAIIAQAQSNAQELHNASFAYVDEDHSELSGRLARAFLPPYFLTAVPVWPRRHRPPDEHRNLYVHSRHPAQFRARLARRAAPGRSSSMSTPRP